jgi:hypothetical protein
MVVTRRFFPASLALWSMGLAVAAQLGCAGPAWFIGAEEGGLANSDLQVARVYPKAAAPHSKAPAQAAANTAAPSASGLNPADTQRLEAIEQQLAKYQQYTSPKPAASTPLPTPPQPSASPSSAASSAAPAAPPAAPPAASGAASDASAAAERVKTPSLASLNPTSAMATAVATDSSPSDVKLAALETPADASGTNPPSAAEAKYQAGDWLVQRDNLIASLREEIRLRKEAEKQGSGATPAETVEQLETLLRMQYALAGRRDEAVAPVEGLREAEQEFWRHQAFGMVDLLGPDRLTSESRRYAVALKSIEEAETHLAAASSLTLRNLALCRKVQDFGVIERFTKPDFTRNQEVLLYVEVRNFGWQKANDNAYETELQGSFRVLDRSGTARAERTLPLDKQTSANVRRDYYIAYRLYIPSELAPGSYTLELTVEDKKGNKSNNALLDFNIVP